MGSGGGSRGTTTTTSQPTIPPELSELFRFVLPDIQSAYKLGGGLERFMGDMPSAVRPIGGQQMRILQRMIQMGGGGGPEGVPFGGGVGSRMDPSAYPYMTTGEPPPGGWPPMPGPDDGMPPLMNPEVASAADYFRQLMGQAPGTLSPEEQQAARMFGSLGAL